MNSHHFLFPGVTFCDLPARGGTALGVGAVSGSYGLAHAADSMSSTASAGAAHPGRYNILFILTDQERFFRPGELPIG